MVNWSVFALYVGILHDLVKTEKPVFNQKFPYFFDVQEGARRGHLIGYVNASVSYSNQHITYETSPILNNAIMINKTSGGLYVNGTIDADIPDVIDIQFSVYAYTVPNEKVSIKVYVIISDVNDNYPVFQNVPYQANITEDFPINSYVTRVKATDVDRKGLSELIYGIQGWTRDSPFIIKEFAGTIWTNKRLDYERDQSHTLNISVTDGRPSDPNRHTVFTTVKIFVIDFDDQGAKFAEYSYYASVQEGKHNNTKLIQLHATDLDRGINAPVAYSILPASNPDGIYRIDRKTGLVTIHGEIDRESTGSSFYLIAQATSTSHEPATTNIVISINDTNDNAPKFQNARYIGNVLENSLHGTKIIQISAYDADEGINKELGYSITGGNGHFDIDSKGYVIVNGSLDRESKDAYVFEVHAKERLTIEKFAASANVTIYIEDVNDNSPVFEKSIFDVEVAEEMSPSVFIVQLNATDKDFGKNSLISYSIVPDAENRHKDFYIDSSTGILYTAKRLDRESVASYSLLIKATDRASPGQTRESICTVKVEVGDVNDNEPHFPQNRYVTSVNEAANLNTIVLAIKALDKDAGINAELEYQISPTNVSNFFKIDPNSGLIKTAKYLDRESIDAFNLQIQVKDGGNKTSSVKVIVKILDVNDNAPVFTIPSGYNFTTIEGRKGLHVGVVQAFDTDEGDSGVVKYSIANSDKFIIDPKNGTIITATELDRESISIHKITVVAEDSFRIAPRNSYAQVVIEVLDVNDNAPRFADPKEYSVVMRRDAEVGSFVYRFKATDPDEFENGKLTYFLAEEFQGLFLFDNATGVLRVKSTLSNMTDDSMIINITVSDHGVPKMTDSGKLLIYFANIVKNAPIIDPPVIKASIKENERKGVLVYDINAKYNGKTNEESFRYSIIHGDETKFKIHFENGQISTLQALDRETTAKYTLIIMVQLRLQNAANFATVEVTVEDDNDNPPLFPTNVLMGSVYENQQPNTTVTAVFATDIDKGINAKVSYYLNGSDHFMISKHSGIISTTVILDRERISEYNLTLTAVNELSSKQLVSSYEMHIHVLDLDDNPPKFEKSVYFGTVAENAPLGTSIVKVTAHDGDKGENSYMKYDIQENDCFSIEWETGVVRSSCIIDRETNASFTLLLTARGIISPSLASTARLNVASLDVDDNHPHFTSKFFRLSPSENLRLGSYLGTLSIADDDLSVGRVEFEIFSGNDADYFTLNNITGVLILNKELDRETTSYYELVVRVYSLSAQNKVVRKRRSTQLSSFPHDQATVLINVEDVNDNSPVFIKTTFIAAVREDAKFNAVITQIYANDSDIGKYGSLVYKITSGNEENLVSLEKTSGKLRVFKSLVGDAGKTISCVITANDNDGSIPSNKAINLGAVRIHVIGDKQTGIVLIEAARDYLHENVRILESVLGNVTNATVTIDKISPTENKKLFQVFFHAIDEDKQRILSKYEIKSLVKPAVVPSLLLHYNITWYLESTPTTAKSTSKKDSNYEIYIGVIASIAILLIITCAFAIWAVFFRKTGFSTVPIKDSEATQFNLRKTDRKDRTGVDTRTNTLETFSNPYSVETVRSTKSTNRYIIEPYESNENIEADERVNPEAESHLNESPFYTVEPYEEPNLEAQPSYLDPVTKYPSKWAYGDRNSSNIDDDDDADDDDDIDKIFVKKLSTLTESQIKLSMNGRMSTTIADDTFVSKDSLTTGGPLFTSEKFEETSFAFDNHLDDFERESGNQESCKYQETVEETCDVDGSTANNLTDFPMEQTQESDSTKESIDITRDLSYTMQFSDNTTYEPMTSCSPSSNPFALLSRRFGSSAEDVQVRKCSQGNEDVTDINQNENGKNMLPTESVSSVKINENEEDLGNENMVTYL